jgi:hypothetical protein
LNAAGGEASRATDIINLEIDAGRLQPIVDAAIQRLEAAGLSAELFTKVGFSIADLPGATLGIAMGNSMTIDGNAAVRGWFVDSTPLDDVEFAMPGGRPQVAAQSIDLLTTIMHELGHVAGLTYVMGGSRSSCLRQERGPVTPDVKPDRHLRVCSRHRPRNVEIAWNVAVAKNGGFTGTLRADLASQDRHARSVLTRFQPPTPAGFAAVCPGCEHRVDSLSDHR